MKKPERINFLTHLSGAILMGLATVVLMISARAKTLNFTTAVIYGICSILLFTASALYHLKKKEENERSIWRTLDHISIYIMIAGTYTPICILVFKNVWGIIIISVQWSLALAGFLSELFWHERPRWLSTVLYTIMGWVAIVAVVPLANGLPFHLFALLITGGLTYTLGAIIYACKKPNPIPGVLGFHEIFHILVLLANGFFFFMIYNVIVTF